MNYFRKAMRSESPQKMGSWFSDAFSNINLNPMDSPITQTVINTTAPLVNMAVQPITQTAAAVGLPSPLNNPVLKAVAPVVDIVGVTFGMGPISHYLGMGGGLLGSTQNPPRPAQRVVVQYVQQKPAAGAAPTIKLPAGAIPAGTPAALAAMQKAGYRTGAWPSYRRTK